MIGRIAAHVTDSNGETISHSNDPELGDGILFKVLVDELLDIGDGEQVTAWPEVLLQHCSRKVNHENKVPYNATL